MSNIHEEATMKEERYRKGQVVFREGDAGDCLYYVRWGSVGVYTDYGTRSAKKLAVLGIGDYFGEMGLLEHESRSATIVSLDHDTVLNRISDTEFEEFLKENPAKVMDILRRLSHKLRDTTRKYLEICQEVNKSVGSDAKSITEAKVYGFAQSEPLKAVHDSVQAKTNSEA